MRLREVKADMVGYTTELMAKVADKNRLDMQSEGERGHRFQTARCECDDAFRQRHSGEKSIKPCAESRNTGGNCKA